MIFPIIAATFLASFAHAELPSDFEQKVQQLISKHLSKKSYVGLSISVVTPNKTFQFHEGQADLARNQKPSNTTIYEIGSISKTFTGLLLANQDEVKLSDAIDSHLPNYVRAPRPDNKSFTFENLATHTAFYFSVPCTIRIGSDSLKCFGVDLESDNPYKNVTRDQLYDYVSEYSYTVEEFKFRQPGLHFSHSNVGFGLIGEILAEKKSLTYEDLLREEIFNVLDMPSSHVGDNAPLGAEVAKVYTKKVQNGDWQETSRWIIPGMAGAGGIRSNLQDMTNYLKSNMGLFHTSLDQAIIKGQSFLEEASRLANTNLCASNETPEEDLCNSSPNYFYLAWAGGMPGSFLYHAGETGGSQSMMIFNQKKTVGIVILSNSSLRSDLPNNRHFPNDLSLCIMQMAGEPVVDIDLCTDL